eukprot:727537-Hanusia_phi.AAC.1
MGTAPPLPATSVTQWDLMRTSHLHGKRRECKQSRSRHDLGHKDPAASRYRLSRSSHGSQKLPSNLLLLLLKDLHTILPSRISDHHLLHLRSSKDFFASLAKPAPALTAASAPFLSTKLPLSSAQLAPSSCLVVIH